MYIQVILVFLDLIQFRIIDHNISSVGKFDVLRINHISFSSTSLSEIIAGYGWNSFEFLTAEICRDFFVTSVSKFIDS